MLWNHGYWLVAQLKQKDGLSLYCCYCGVGGMVQWALRLSGGGAGSPDTPGDWFPLWRQGMWCAHPLFLPDTIVRLCDLWATCGQDFWFIRWHRADCASVSNSSVCTAAPWRTVSPSLIERNPSKCPWGDKQENLIAVGLGPMCFDFSQTDTSIFHTDCLQP